MDDGEPARPAPTPCERALEAKSAENARLCEELAAAIAENARLQERIAELEAKLRPYPGPPAGPFLPYPPEGPWGKGPGGPRSSP
jgi:hypothetical protein